MFFEDVLGAAGTVLAVKNMILLFCGVIAGIVIGATPGLTITMAVVLVLPFTFGLSPIEGLSAIIGVLVGGLSGGLFSAVLIGIPGTPAAVVSILDGHPMARGGRPELALGLGVWASFFGGLISAFLLVLSAPWLSRIGLEFGPWEYFSLLLFALTMAASLSGDSLLKGLIACTLGLLIAAMGGDPVNGVSRLSYGLESLDRGINYLSILIGVFAFGSLMRDVQDRTKARQALMVVGASATRIAHVESIRICFRQWRNLLRSSIIGMITGVLPAVSGTVATFIAYDQAKKASSEPEKFGSGHAEGIVAPEAANNADAGGALAILMALGVPGDAVSAVMLGALMVHGVVPSPSFMSDAPVLAYGIIITFFLAHFVMIAVQAVGLRLFLLTARVPTYVLATGILTFCAIGAFSINNQVFDIWIVLWFGILGYMMRLLNFPVAPLVLGVVLGAVLETNLVRALSTSSDPLMFVTRPMSLLFLVLAAFSALFPWYQDQRGKAAWTRWYSPAFCLASALPMFFMPGFVRPVIGVLLLGAAAYVAFRASGERWRPGPSPAH